MSYVILRKETTTLFNDRIDVHFLYSIVFLLVVGCGRSDPIPCSNRCDNPGETRCAGVVLQVCSENDNRCIQWLDWVDCSYYDQACTESDGSAECSRTCSDACKAEGDTRCDGTVIQTCALGEKGCLGWVSGTDCSVYDEVCDMEGGQALCTVVCEDECAVQGSTKCGGTFILTCAVNYYGCLYWEYGRDCADDGLICEDTGGYATCGPCIPDCSGRHCGPDPVCGQSCGTCMVATEVCRLDTGICEDVCAGKECGTFEGIYCGACAGVTEVCRQNTGLCEDVCAGRECGTVEGIDCGECSEPTEICRDTTGECEDVCFGRECGVVDEIDCGPCPDNEICNAGQCFIPICSDGMCHVPSGTFWMGCNGESDHFCENDEKPFHEVYLDSFDIDQYEVTQAQYFVCIQDGVCELPTGNFDPALKGSHPVVSISWTEASTFCMWNGKRLCTEAEWEKAARGTDGRSYPWGNEIASCEYAVMDDGIAGCGNGTTMPVGSKPAGVSPYGARDMAGNAREWVSDWYDPNYYLECTTSCINPQGPINDGSLHSHIVRGGEYKSGSIELRTSDRDICSLSEFCGFRCCR